MVNTPAPILTIVLPCFNEEEVISQTLARMFDVVSSEFDGKLCEILIVDDGSTDRTVDIIQEISTPENLCLRVLSFSRNFGHQAAISAGIASARGEAVAIIDADLQDPPELLPEMFRRLQDGYDVVSGKRISRDGVPLWKKGSYALFYRMWKAVSSDLDIPLDTGDFRIMSRRAVDLLVAMPEKNRFVRGLLPYVGLPHTSVEYERHARLAGIPKYTFSKLVQLAFDGLFSFSTRPLRLALYFGAILFIFAILGAGLVIVDRLMTDDWAPGWAGTLVVLLSFGGVQFLILGIMGEYLGKIFDEVKSRPPYFIAREYELGSTPSDLD